MTPTSHIFATPTDGFVTQQSLPSPFGLADNMITDSVTANEPPPDIAKPYKTTFPPPPFLFENLKFITEFVEPPTPTITSPTAKHQLSTEDQNRGTYHRWRVSETRNGKYGGDEHGDENGENRSKES